MQTCVNIAMQNLGRTGKNPSVGALIWNDNKVATGVTSLGGVPHAETNAIAKAIELGVDCQNSTLFVTLEPCSHFGKTPPCVDTIINAGIKHVVVGMKDPDLRVNGDGIAKLLQAGIQVEMLQIKEVAELYRGYNIFKTQNRPYVSLKIACSLDGKIALANGLSKWITCEEVRRCTNFLRSRFCGILIGANTYRADLPFLTCRVEGLEQFSPKRFVVSSNNIDGYSSVSGSVHKILEQLYRDDVQSVLVEGGANLITQFVEADIFDEIITVQAPIFLGHDSKSCIKELSLTALPLQSMSVESVRNIGNNVFTKFYKTLPKLG